MKILRNNNVDDDIGDGGMDPPQLLPLPFGGVNYYYFSGNQLDNNVSIA